MERKCLRTFCSQMLNFYVESSVNNLKIIRDPNLLSLHFVSLGGILDLQLKDFRVKSVDSVCQGCFGHLEGVEFLCQSRILELDVIQLSRTKVFPAGVATGGAAIMTCLVITFEPLTLS